VILSVFFLDAEALDPLYVILPLGLAGLVTVALFSVQWLVQLFAGEDPDSKSHKSF
jgi:hypothetical protein